MGENNGEYNKIQNASLYLKFYSQVDQTNLTNAEGHIKKYFNDINAHIKYDNYNELVVLDPKVLDNINKKYKEIRI